MLPINVNQSISLISSFARGVTALGRGCWQGFHLLTRDCGVGACVEVTSVGLNALQVLFNSAKNSWQTHTDPRIRIKQDRIRLSKSFAKDLTCLTDVISKYVAKLGSDEIVKEATPRLNPLPVDCYPQPIGTQAIGTQVDPSFVTILGLDEIPLKEIVVEILAALRFNFDFSLSVDKSYYHDLIDNNLQVNILRLLADLSDKPNAEGHFTELKAKPAAKLFAFLKPYIQKSLEESKFYPLNEKQRDILYRAYFNNLSKELLAAAFPKGADDILLFLPIPGIHLTVRSLIWDGFPNGHPIKWEGINEFLSAKLYDAFSRSQRMTRYSHIDESQYVIGGNKPNLILSTVKSTVQFGMDKAIDFVETNQSPISADIVKLGQDRFDALGITDDRIKDMFTKYINNENAEFVLADAIKFFKESEMQPVRELLFKLALPFLIKPAHGLTTRFLDAVSKKLKVEGYIDIGLEQGLIHTALPILLQHFKNLNQTVAGEIQTVAGEIQTEHFKGVDDQKKFCEDQVEVIFSLIYPFIKEDAISICKELNISEDELNIHIATLKEKLKKDAATELPKMLDKQFSRQVLTPLFSSIYESTIESLNAGIKLPYPEVPEDNEMDEAIGELFFEMAKFLNLPVGPLEKMPNWLKRVTGVNAAQKSIAASIGYSVRYQFDGKFFENNFMDNLSKLESIKFTKNQDASEPAHARTLEEEQIHLNAQEKLLAKTLIRYIFRYIGAFIAYKTDIFTNPALKGLRNVILSAFAFAFIVIGKVLQKVGVEPLLVWILSSLLHASDEKIISVGSNKDLHKNMVFEMASSAEEVMAAFSYSKPN